MGSKFVSYSDKKRVFAKGLTLKRNVQGAKSVFEKEEYLKKSDERIVVLSTPDSLASEEYRVLYSRFHQFYRGDKKKIIAISSSIKGEGKTTTCLNLGTVIAKDFGKKVLIIEGDLKQPDLYTYLSSPMQKGLIDVLLGKENFGDCIYSFLSENLFLLPTGASEVNSSKFLSLPKMGEMLSQASEEFDYIIIDARTISYGVIPGNLYSVIRLLELFIRGIGR